VIAAHEPGLESALTLVTGRIEGAQAELDRFLKDGAEAADGSCRSAGGVPGRSGSETLDAHLGLLVAKGQVEALRTVEVDLLRRLRNAREASQ
jgi:hypothetical protein